MELRIRLLGAVELRVGGERSRLGSAKERRALAALAWDAGRTVSIDTLVHRIWDDSPPTNPRGALYALIARIRRTLEALAGDRAPALTNGTHTYALEVDPDAVDLRRYLSLLNQASCLADSDSGREALRFLEEAAALWTGDPLAGMPGAWPEDLRSTVTERNLAAAQLRAGLALQRGRYAEAVAELLPLADRHLADELLLGQLAVALYGSGRRGEATRWLQRCRHHSLSEFGAEPGEGMQRIHRGILTGAPVTALIPSSKDGNSDAPTRTPPDTLPGDVVWVGRDAELARLTGALSGAHGETSVVALEALDGMGGVGKTALAVHAAHQLHDRFPDGRLFLDLRGNTALQAPLTPAEALTELLRQLGTPGRGMPEELDALIALWRTTVRDRRIVVVLDDAAGPEQVRPLLPTASPALVIITSRRRLAGLPGVRPISLDVLPDQDAIALFQRLMGERAPDASEAAHVVRLVGHLPMGITLAASRLLTRPSWSVADLIDRFNRAGGRLPEIRSGQTELSQVFAVSYQTLSARQQLAFRRLGLHTGSEFGSPAAAALIGLRLDETERVLEDLLSYHLIAEPSPHRYRLHDLLREHARTLAAREPEEDTREAVGHLIDHYLHAADRADRLAFPHRARIAISDSPLPEGSGRVIESWVGTDPQQWFTVEGPNLLAALEYVRAHGTQREVALLTHTLAGFLDNEGYLATAEPLLRRAVAFWQGADDDGALARALLDLAGVATRRSDYDVAIRAASQALKTSQELRDGELEAESLHLLSIPHWHAAKYREAFDYQWRALNLRLRTTDRLQQARSFNLLGMTSLHLARYKESLKFFLEALSRFREVDDRRGQWIALNNLAELYKEVGDLESAHRAYRQAISLSRAMGSKGEYATLQMNLASTLHAVGRADEALDLFRKALPSLRGMGDRRSESIATNGIGRALHTVGRSEEALPYHTAALALARRIHAAQEEAQALRDLGRAEQATGRFVQASAHLESSLAISQEIGARSEVSETRETLADVRRMMRRRNEI
ncbi:tetratricopeptide repeat protein [Streptomyces sp. CT34]|uniref:AfsR/SARP family transcriptional regulator n=1 Tax=Streptomyces sp. CT34 TaxID=1553907 RepID=UPI0005BD3976|nr:tetratricopeptide repeat protein [Streptomyces sp. CT34]